MRETRESRVKALDKRVERYRTEESPVFTDRSGSPQNDPVAMRGLLADIDEFKHSMQADIAEFKLSMQAQLKGMLDQVSNLPDTVNMLVSELKRLENLRARQVEYLSEQIDVFREVMLQLLETQQARNAELEARVRELEAGLLMDEARVRELEAGLLMDEAVAPPKPEGAGIAKTRVRAAKTKEGGYRKKTRKRRTRKNSKKKRTRRKK